MDKVKYIKRPEPILINGLDPFTDTMFVEHLINSDDHFNKNGPGIRAGIRIEDAFKTDNSIIQLDEKLWLLLKEAAENPSGGYPAVFVKNESSVEKIYFGRKLLPFIDAIVDASDENPAEPANG